MAKLTYAEQLKHPNWQRLRLKALERADWACERCRDKETMLNVHHKRYVKGRMAWEYGLDELSVMCQPCHEQRHANEEIIYSILANASKENAAAYEIAAGLLAGYFFGLSDIDPAVAEMGQELHDPAYDAGVVAAAAAVSDIDWIVEFIEKIELADSPAIADLVSRYKAGIEWRRNRA